MSQGETRVAVPDYQSFMLPILRLLADGKEHSLVELHGRLAGEMNLTSADLEERLPSGTQTKYSNRVQWSTVYLAKAGVLNVFVAPCWRSLTAAASCSWRIIRRLP